MPELPEVENLRRGLEKYILEQKIVEAKITKPKLVFSNGTIRKISPKKVKDFINGVKGEKFVSVKRRAKNIIFELSHNKALLAHLKMTGQFVYKPKKQNLRLISGGHPIELSETTSPNKHSHIIFELEKGTLYYNDTRMFGYVLYYPDASSLLKEKHLSKLGVEPLSKDFSLKYFTKALGNKKSKIKSVLMGQDVVVGVGNIYTDESLFRAKIHPERIASSLNKKEIEALYKAIKIILTRAIKVGGSSVATYRLIDESRGNYAREHKVYGKAGEPCVKCAKPLKRILIQSRATIYCSNCQK